ncbi:hypothetical protein F5883DRAFT_613110 [Diaporthe sp. PMI_573]|nr:hypothetical protein F5883DRAFT_613110 [Diaporthaceae sp. PMI_573]
MELAAPNHPSSAVVFRPPRQNTRMEHATPNPTGAVVFHPPRRCRHHRRHRYYHNHHSDSDTDSTLSRSSSCSSDSDYDDDSAYYHQVSFRPRHRARRSWWPSWPRGGVLAYPGSYSSPWATTAGAGVIGTAGLVPAPAGLVSTVVPQLQLQQPQAQQQQQQPRRYGYRRFHYQGGERRRRCEDGGADCCDEGCGVGAVTTTPTVHHEDEYWGPGHFSTIPNWASGSQNSPWRYGGPNGTNTNGPDTVGPGGTIEEVEEGGTAPSAAAAQQPLSTTAIVPVPMAPAGPIAIDPYDQQPQHTHHYHLNNDDDRRRKRSRHAQHGHHSRRRWWRRGDEVDDGVLGLVERERRRDSERQMADADASHRREAMMMELMERARRGERDRDRDGGRGAGGLDARDILGVLLDDVAERRGRREGQRGNGAGEGGGESGGDDRWKGALDALSRRVDEMVLSGREEKERGRAAERIPASARTRTTRNTAPRVKFSKVGSDSGSAANNSDGGGFSGGGKSATAGANITFSRRGRDRGRADTDTDETSGSSSVGRGRAVRTRGRALRRAGSPSTSID